MTFVYRLRLTLAPIVSETLPIALLRLLDAIHSSVRRRAQMMRHDACVARASVIVAVIHHVWRALPTAGLAPLLTPAHAEPGPLGVEVEDALAVAGGVRGDHWAEAVAGLLQGLAGPVANAT